MAKQDVKKVYSNAVLYLDEMMIHEHDKDGNLIGKFSLQSLLEDIEASGMGEFGVFYKSAITPDEE